MEEFYSKLSKEELIRVVINLKKRLSEKEKELEILRNKKDAPQPINIKVTPIEEYVSGNPRRKEIYNIISNSDLYRLSEKDIKFLNSIVDKVGLSQKQKTWLEGIKKRVK
jgi:hypothetical protein